MDPSSMLISSAVMYIQSVLLQTQSLDSEFENLKTDMQWAHKRLELLILLLQHLNGVCVDEFKQLLERKEVDQNSSKVLELCGDISQLIANVGRQLESINTVSSSKQPAWYGKTWENLQNAITKTKPQWQIEKDKVISGINEIQEQMDILSAIVAARHVTETRRVLEQIKQLRNDLQERPSTTNPPKQQRKPKTRSSRAKSKSVSTGVSIPDMATTFVKNMCERNGSCRWYRLQGTRNSSAAVVLIKDYGDSEKIVGFIVWRWGDAEALPETYRLDERSGFRTYPFGKTGEGVTVLVSKKKVSLRFQKVTDAQKMRGSMENCVIHFTTSLKTFSVRYAERNLKADKILQQKPRQVTHNQFFAEVLDINGSSKHRVLQIWSLKDDKFEADKDSVFLYQVSKNSKCIVQEPELILLNSVRIETRKGTHYLQTLDGEDNADSNKAEYLEGDFVFQFPSDQSAEKIKTLLFEPLELDSTEAQ